MRGQYIDENFITPTVKIGMTVVNHTNQKYVNKNISYFKSVLFNTK